MEIEEEEVKWEATEPEKDGAVRTLGLRRRRAPEQPFPVFDAKLFLEFYYSDKVSLKWFQDPGPEIMQPNELSILHYLNKVERSPIKHMSVRQYWMQVSDIDLSNLEILPQFVRSFFYQAHDKIHDSIAAFFSQIFPLKSVNLSDNDLRRLEKLHELASGNNQTVPQFLREEFPELRSWNDQSLQQLIANKIIMEKLRSLASRKTQQPLPDVYVYSSG